MRHLTQHESLLVSNQNRYYNNYILYPWPYNIASTSHTFLYSPYKNVQFFFYTDALAEGESVLMYKVGIT